MIDAIAVGAAAAFSLGKFGLRPSAWELTWPPQNMWHSEAQSAMQIWTVGESLQRPSQAETPAGASHAASQAGLAHTPGSCVPSCSETRAPTSTSLGVPSESCRLRK